MARAPKQSPRNRLDPLKSKRTEQRVERAESGKKVQAREQDKRRMKDSQKLMKGSHRHTP